MPAITPTLMTGTGQRLVNEVTLGASGNILTYKPGQNQILILRNPTAGALSPVIDGSAGTTVDKPGLSTISVAAGYPAFAIAVGAVRAIPLDTISDYLQGVVDITAGTGLVAILLEFY